MDTKKWIRRAKLVAAGAFLGLLLIWLGVMIAGALSDNPSHPSRFDRVLKK